VTVPTPKRFRYKNERTLTCGIPLPETAPTVDARERASGALYRITVQFQDPLASLGRERAVALRTRFRTSIRTPLREAVKPVGAPDPYLDPSYGPQKRSVG
jgi:hypothetical protein